MANVYVRSSASGSNNGTTKNDAYTTLTAAIAGSAAGDTYYVASDHAESTAGAVTLTFKGTNASPDRVLCVNFAGSTPPAAADLTTGASVETTGANSITSGGYIHAHGIIFKAGSGAVTANISTGSGGPAQTYKSCSFRLISTGASSRIVPCTTGGSMCMFEECTISFGSTSQALSVGNAPWRWKNNGLDILAAGSLVPTTMFSSSGSHRFEIEDADLSQFGAGKTLIPAGGLNIHPCKLVNCKLGASVTVAAAFNVGLPTFLAYIDVIGCGSTGVVSRNERYRYQGTLTTETTIVRTGGASDGTTSYSWKVATTANNKRDFPFETFEGSLWNAATGSAKTLTVHTVTDNVTLTDAEIWLEVDYLGSSATPISSVASDAPATILTTAANQATSNEAWTTTGLTTPVKQRLDVTFTPQMAGPIRWRVKVAKASTTVYICPKAELT